MEAGGEIFPLQGIDRVMGQLAVTRAIGDTDLKPYITSEPEIVSFELDGDEDFIIMASDGLWDGVTEDAAASEVYNQLKVDPGKTQREREEFARIDHHLPFTAAAELQIRFADK